MNKPIQIAGWRNLERGQALTEYWPAIPASILVMVLAGVMTTWMNGAYQKTRNGLTGNWGVSGCTPVVAPASTETPGQTGTTSTMIFNHQFVVVAQSYDAGTDRTTVAYQVTSGRRPSISHWMLGISREMEARILASSEAYVWSAPDPTTGKTGVKFDIGYSDNETRTIILTFSGELEFGDVEITTKAGRTQIGTSMLAAPIGEKEDAPVEASC
jgi:hypothetical protein